MCPTYQRALRRVDAYAGFLVIVGGALGAGRLSHGSAGPLECSAAEGRSSRPRVRRASTAAPRWLLQFLQTPSDGRAGGVSILRQISKIYLPIDANVLNLETTNIILGTYVS